MLPLEPVGPDLWADPGRSGLFAATAAGLATTVPVAVFLLVLWLLQVRPRRGTARWAFPVAAALVLAVTFTPAPIHAVAVVLVALVVLVISGRRGVKDDEVSST